MTAWYGDGLRFECTRCGACCAGEPGYVWVTRADIEVIAASLGISVSAFMDRYTRVVEGRRSLRERANGDCILLRSGKCAAYHVRPHQCRTWPFWRENLTSAARWRSLAEGCPGIGRGAARPFEDVARILASRRSYNRMTRLFGKLLAIYAQCDDGAGEATCRECGDCCQFRKHGHDLYLSAIEAAWMLTAAGPPGRILRGECPYFESGRCGNRAGRALGCRTYFCDRDDASAWERHEVMLGRIRKVTIDSEIPWEYGRIDSVLQAVADEGGKWGSFFSVF